jgi:spermidine synthase
VEPPRDKLKFVGHSAARQHSLAYSQAAIILIGLCFIFSGATGLIYEVLWARMLGLVFGATTLAVSTVLAAFMGGLALGSALAGRLGCRIKRPLSAYGWLEIGIAIYAILVPLLFRWVDHLYVLIWQEFQPGFFIFSVWRFVLSCLLLLLPTTLMGATLPVLSSALLSSLGHDSRSVTKLYACNLAGAILGTVVAGFVLLPVFGVRSTIFIAAVINTLIGVTAVIADHRTSRTEIEAAVEDMVESSGEVTGKTFWSMCALASGFVTISTQVAWTRMLTMIIGSSTYAFSIVVALFLIGLALGAWIIGRKDQSVNLRATILKVEVLTAASLFISLFVVNFIPWMLIKLGLALKVSSWPSLLMLQILSAALLILLPALLMGMVMPLVLCWASSGDGAVLLVGRTYAGNTIGAIAGAFISGFVLIPRTSTKFTLMVASATCLIVAGCAYQPPESIGDPGLRRSLAAGLTFALIMLLVVAAPPVNVADLSVGAYDTLVRMLARRDVTTTDESSQDNGSPTHRLVMYEEGPTSTVSVRKDGETFSMAINGRTNASDSSSDMPTQVMLGELPMLLAPRLNNGLIIGFATGVTVGAMLQSPIASVTCVELESATIKGSHFFEHVNHQPLNDPRTKLIIDDARTHLRVTTTRYDVIVSEPSHPWVPGVANLFTREFFEMSRQRLSEQGVFVQWLQIYQLSTESLRSVLATYHSVFPHVMVFRVGGAGKGKDLILVGSNSPLNLDLLSQRLADERIAKEMSRVGLKTEADVRGWYICDESRLGDAVIGATINTDDNMHIETTVPKEAFRPLMQTNADWVERLKT